MRAAFVLTALIVVAGCAPKDIARGSCSNTVLSVHDEWNCTVKADIVGQGSSVEFDTESRNQVAQVHISMRVTKGTVRVRYADLTGSKEVLVTPSEPMDVNMKTKMHPERRSFTLHFEPVNGNAEGLDGAVKYSTPPQG
jgi:hypothetical protein